MSKEDRQSASDTIVRNAINAILAIPKEKRGSARKKLLNSTDLVEAVSNVLVSNPDGISELLKLGDELVFRGLLLAWHRADGVQQERMLTALQKSRAEPDRRLAGAVTVALIREFFDEAVKLISGVSPIAALPDFVRIDFPDAAQTILSKLSDSDLNEFRRRKLATLVIMSLRGKEHDRHTPLAIQTINALRQNRVDPSGFEPNVRKFFLEFVSTLGPKQRAEISIVLLQADDKYRSAFWDIGQLGPLVGQTLPPRPVIQDGPHEVSVASPPIEAVQLRTQGGTSPGNIDDPPISASPATALGAAPSEPAADDIDRNHQTQEQTLRAGSPTLTLADDRTPPTIRSTGTKTTEFKGPNRSAASEIARADDHPDVSEERANDSETLTLDQCDDDMGWLKTAQIHISQLIRRLDEGQSAARRAKSLAQTLAEKISEIESLSKDKHLVQLDLEQSKKEIGRVRVREEQLMSSVHERDLKIRSLEVENASKDGTLKELTTAYEQRIAAIEESRLLYGTQKIRETKNALSERISRELDDLPELVSGLGQEHFELLRIRFARLLALLEENDVLSPMPGARR